VQVQPENHPGLFGDYELLEEIARGGMGVVYRARQRSLNRLVALKMIGTGRSASALELRRFRIEAEAAAQLEHPAIVPIYEVGEHDGFAYFSMQFIEGGSLEDCLARFRKDVRSAARLIVTVARAVHHAHRHGILHRDLKPANILLDSTGQPHITDFGLAKRITPDEPMQSLFAGEPPARRTSTQAMTQLGVIVGTPNFMPPEQADPRRGPVTIAADVYGLGAVFYTLLTGRPPFTGESTIGVLMQVVAEPPPAPRRSNPKVDHDLEFICLKCLEKTPERRYASAEDVARELERWLAGEPIKARPVSALGRTWKWARRRPTAAALVVVSAVAALALTIGGLWYGDRLRGALQEARQGRDAAQRNYLLAARAVEDMVRRMEDETLPALPAVERVRRAVLLDALEFNKQFLAERDEDPKVCFEAGKAYRRVGGIHRLLGQLDQALSACDSARALQQAACQQLAHDPEPRRELAVVEQQRGSLLDTVGQLEEAEQAFLAAQRLREELLQSHPDDAESQRQLARIQADLGSLLGELGRTDEAERSLHRAVEISARLAKEHPDTARHLFEQARSLGSLGRVVADSGRPRLAEPSFRKAVELCAHLAGQHPTEPQYRKGLARARVNLGALLAWSVRAPRRLAEAEEELSEARDLCRKLVEDFPDVPEYRQELASSLVNFGLATRDQPGRKRQAAEGAMREALTLRQRLVKECPAVPRYQRELARSHDLLGRLLDVAGQAEAAEAQWQAALALQRKLVLDHPTIPGFLNDLGNTLDGLGESSLRRQQATAARSCLEEAVQWHRRAIQANAHTPVFRRALIRDYDQLADALARLNDHPALRQRAEELITALPSDAEARYQSARMLARSVTVLSRANLSQVDRATQTRRDADRAMERIREAIGKGWKDTGRLKTDPQLAPLRDREDFRTLLAAQGK